MHRFKKEKDTSLKLENEKMLLLLLLQLLFIQSCFHLTCSINALPTVLLTKNFSQLTPSIQRSLFSQRIIWILWWQGLSRSPLIVQKCFESWKVYHDNSSSTLQKKIIPWRIVELNRTNVEQFVNLSHYLPDIGS